MAEKLFSESLRILPVYPQYPHTDHDDLQASLSKLEAMDLRLRQIPKPFSSLNPSAGTTIKYGTRPEEAEQLFKSAGIKLNPEEYIAFAQYWSKQNPPEDFQDAKELLSCCVRQMSRRCQALYCVNVRSITRKMAETYGKRQHPSIKDFQPPVTIKKKGFKIKRFDAKEAEDVIKKIKRIQHQAKKIRHAEAKLPWTPCPQKPGEFFRKPVLRSTPNDSPRCTRGSRDPPKFPLAKLQRLASQHRLTTPAAPESWEAPSIIEVHPCPKASEEEILAAIKIAKAQGDLCPSPDQQSPEYYDSDEEHENECEGDDDYDGFHDEIRVGDVC